MSSQCVAAFLIIFLVIDKGGSLKGADRDTQLNELLRCVSALEDGSADVAVLKKLALLCLDNPVHDDAPNMNDSSFPITPSPTDNGFGTMNVEDTIWNNEKIFDRLFDALMKYLSPSRVSDLYDSLILSYLMLGYYVVRSRAGVWTDSTLGDAREPVTVS